MKNLRTKNMVYPIFFKFITFFIFFISFTNISAQSICLMPVPADVEVIKRSPIAEKIGKKRNYWICNNAQVIFSFGDATCLVESGVKLVIMRGFYTIYLKEGAVLDVSIGANCRVYYEGHASIIQKIPTAQIEYIPCQNLVFDYTNAPKNLCNVVEEPLEDAKEMENNNTPTEETDDLTKVENTPIANEYDSLPPIDQIDHVIPMNVIAINPRLQSNAYNNGDKKAFWICSGANLTFNGTNSVFYVESRANLRINSGSNNTVYLKSDANLSIAFSNQNKVYYLEGANLIDNKGKNRFTKLFEMEFDYSQTNAEGCR